jgi:hypothetical protein
MNQETKIEQWAERELRRALDRAILPDDDGGYIVFGKYSLVPQDTGILVNTWGNEIHCFMNKRHAMSWCILDHKGNYTMANRLIALDRRKNAVGSDIHVRRNIGERGKTPDFRETVNLKISTKIQALTSLTQELDKCISYAKYLQTKGFANETARTSRT